MIDLGTWVVTHFYFADLHVAFLSATHLKSVLNSMNGHECFCKNCSGLWVGICMIYSSRHHCYNWTTNIFIHASNTPFQVTPAAQTIVYKRELKLSCICICTFVGKVHSPFSSHQQSDIFLWKLCHGWALGFCSHTDFINSINVQLMFAGHLADGNGQFPCPSCRRLVTSPPDGFPVCAISEYISNNLSERSLGNKGKVEVYFLKYFITEHGVNISQKGSDQQPMVHGGYYVETTPNVSNSSNHLRSCII